ncbi:MAG: preprotein translocase subunit SecG [Clostridiaceae bacterium]|nr:preprotein translocase subunit SecG [Clostridiales bacterium]MDD6876304.1 preprotein translocase subunit SecG [Clostridiaceae bacterium]MDY3071472.1 preprotein translocase subunit SecG [Eubacteriales bacterium]MDY3285581.1 preprotein translocase subunit SecG [Eubacteriales bacterium]MDY5015686.1 preprotein translocase subunit SecG [Eubacteriales bacterium]
MGVLTTILTIVQVILCVAVIALVLMQQSKSAGLSGSIGGGAETFFGKNRGRSIDGLLRRLTIIGASCLAVTTLILIMIQ